MELKHRTGIEPENLGGLLIVPYGIETQIRLLL